MREYITFHVFDVGSKTEFTNNSLKSPKIGKLNIDTLIITQGLLIHEKTQTKKSHATVPLKGLSHQVIHFLRFYIETVYRYLPKFSFCLVGLILKNRGIFRRKIRRPPKNFMFMTNRKPLCVG